MIKFRQQITINFYKLTHNVANFLDNEKREFSKIIKNFWAEHMIGDLLKISFFLFLILWIGFQAYHDTSQSHLTHDDYLQIKKATDELYYIINTQEDVLKIQHEKMKKMAEDISYYRQASRSIHPFTAGIFVIIGIGTGFLMVTGGYIIQQVFS